MRKDREEWLNRQMDEELEAMADVRERLLMEMEELQGIEMPEGKLEEIHRELEARKKAEKRRRPRVCFRMAAAVAAVLVLLVGAGVAGSGAKLYVPEIFHRVSGDEVEIAVENSDSTYAVYDEKEVRQEIREKIGVIAPRLPYKPKGMSLKEYEIYEDAGEAFIGYDYIGNSFYVMIAKKNADTISQWKTDGKIVDTLMVESNGLELSIYCYEDSAKQEYFSTSFEYLSTYYYISGMMKQDEFAKILENMIIKNE